MYAMTYIKVEAFFAPILITDKNKNDIKSL